MMSIVFLPLGHGKVASINFEDFDLARPWKWGLGGYKRRYVCRKLPRTPEGRGTQYLHRVLCGSLVSVDHIDGNPLNNCRDNLRPATVQQQARGFQRKPAGTSSKFRGVCWVTRASRWLASVKVSGRAIHIGHFREERDAALAYNAKATELGFSREALNLV